MTPPVIELTDVVNVRRELTNLGRCNRLAWTRGYFDGARYFDSGGSVWTVEHTRPPKPAGWRLWMNRVITQVYNPRMELELVFAPPSPYALDELVEGLCRLVEADPDDLYTQRMSHDHLKRLFRSARSFDHLVRLIEKWI